MSRVFIILKLFSEGPALLARILQISRLVRLVRVPQIVSHIRFVVLVGVLFGLLIGAGSWALLLAPGPHDNARQIIIARGQSLDNVIHELASSGVLRSALVFSVYSRFAGPVQAGEFDLPPRANMRDISRILRLGDVVMHAITVPEGMTSQQVVELLFSEPVLSGEASIPAEGSLLPETYFVPRGHARTALLAKMQAAQDQALEQLWENRQPGLPLQTPQEAVVLASIVEKETGQAGERGQVAAVFVNRLRKRMRLQSDPTIIYGLVGGKGTLGRPIRLSEIGKPTPYNTYTIFGLPPTPIANPGREALAAVLDPPSTSALYFVANGTGGHIFADTLTEHNKNVRRWRKLQKQLRQ